MRADRRLYFRDFFHHFRFQLRSGFCRFAGVSLRSVRAALFQIFSFHLCSARHTVNHRLHCDTRPHFVICNVRAAGYFACRLFAADRFGGARAARRRVDHCGRRNRFSRWNFDGDWARISNSNQFAMVFRPRRHHFISGRSGRRLDLSGA